MGLVSWLRGDDLDDGVETRDWSIGDPAFAEWLRPPNLAGVSVSSETIMTSTAVWRAVNIVAGTIAGLPLKSYRRARDGQREQVPTWLDAPHPYMTPYEWKRLILTQLLLWGDAYLQHIYNGAGALVGAHPVYPPCVTVEVLDGTWGEELYKLMTMDGDQVEVPADDMTHIRALTVDGRDGLGLLDIGTQAVGTGMAGDQAAARAFRDGFVVGGIVTSEDVLSDSEAEAIMARLDARMGGPGNAGRWPFVNKNLTFTPWQQNNADAQMLESRQFQVEEVARLTGVPPHLLMQVEKQTSWGPGVAEQNRGLARFCLSHWTSLLEERLSMLLSRPTFCEFEYAGMLQPSPEEEVRLLLDQVEKGLITVNEARKIRNLPPVPGGDTLRTTPAAVPAPSPEEG